MANPHEISLQQAIDLTTRFRNNQPANMPSICETFEVSAIAKLIETPGCVRVRIYFGMKENMQIVTILVAVNDQGEDILPNDSFTENQPIIVEDGIACPPVCPKPSPLNT